MTGIIHFPTSSRRMRHVSRRALLAGAAGYAAAATFTSHVSGQEASPTDSLATPGASVTNARERLVEMLRLVPPSQLGGADPNIWLFSWLDLDAHLAALGDPDLFDPSTDLPSITTPLVTDDPLLVHSMQQEAREFWGFTSLDVHRTLATGALPESVIYYSGGFDAAALPEIWEAAGYQRKDGMAGEYWTIGENGEFDMEMRIHQMVFARMNNLAIIENDTVVAAPTSDLIEVVQATLASGDASAADDPDIAALVDTLPETAVNVIALPGGGLEASSITPENPGMETSNARLEELLSESDAAVGPMPVSRLAFFGITAGVQGSPTSTMDATQAASDSLADEPRYFVHLLMESEADAEAAAEVVVWRFENMLSPFAGYVYAERFTPAVAPGDAVQGNVATLAFTSPESLASWHTMLGMQDLWPFVWVGPEG